eukprot:1178612-Prorocentrum_minimum.AAC.3
MPAAYPPSPPERLRTASAPPPPPWRRRAPPPPTGDRHLSFVPAARARSPPGAPSAPPVAAGARGPAPLPPPRAPAGRSTCQLTPHAGAHHHWRPGPPPAYWPVGNFRPTRTSTPFASCRANRPPQPASSTARTRAGFRRGGHTRQCSRDRRVRSRSKSPRAAFRLHRSCNRKTPGGKKKKGTPVGVVHRARGPALGSWEDRPSAA